MKIKDLIKELEKLPDDATIGTFDENDSRISDCVYIYEKQDMVSSGVTVSQIETGRISNAHKKCDFYIGY